MIPNDIISLLFSKEYSLKNNFIYIGMILYRGILYPFEDTIVKKVFKEDYILPELFMFIKGICELIIIIIITPFLYFFIWEEGVIFVTNKNPLHILLIILAYTLTSFIKAYLILKVIYYFSSQSVSFLIISESITGSINEIIHYFKSDYLYTSDIIPLIIEFIVILITLFGTLVYDEIIIIKKWGMHKNVAAEIISRSRLEVDSISIIKDKTSFEIEEYEDEYEFSNPYSESEYN